MNEGIHLDLDIWLVPGQIRKANLCRELGNRYTPAGTEVLISAVAYIAIRTYSSYSSIDSPRLIVGVNEKGLLLQGISHHSRPNRR